jgi:hypothetical protein
MLTASKFGSVQAGLMPLYSILSHQSKKIGSVIPWFWKMCSSINICPIGNSVIVVCVYAFKEERALNSAYSMSILRISLSFTRGQLNVFLICGSGYGLYAHIFVVVLIHQVLDGKIGWGFRCIST